MTRPSQSPILSFSPDSPEFPAALRNIPEAPKTLYWRGNPELLTWEPKVAMVGSRTPSAYGKRIAEQIATELAQAGVCIVSGLARGIDGICHQAALEARGKTIAVLGSAIDEITPKQNLALGTQVIADGLLISEYPPGHALRNWQFVARNRLISGLSRAVIIVEAAATSGTLTTAKWALDQGREVMVLPGPADSPLSAGTLQLLRDGARCVRHATDILSDLGLKAEPQLPIQDVSDYNHKENGDPLLLYLNEGPIHMDLLLEKTGLTPAELSRDLLRLELDGQVKQLPGQRYERC